MPCRLILYKSVDYLDGDSVLISVITFDLIENSCFDRESEITLKFENKKLYKIEYIIKFLPENFVLCKALYDKIDSALREVFRKEDSSFGYIYPYKVTIGEGLEKEQIGEGFALFRDETAKKNRKRYKLSLDYYMKYKVDWDSLSQELKKTGEIESYEISIIYYDLTITNKLDIRGY